MRFGKSNVSYWYSLTASESPTYYNIIKCLEKEHWKKTRFQFLSNFNVTHFQFDGQVCENLEYKHLLASLITAQCPWIAPKTYCINDENYPDLLTKLYAQDSCSWILKPSLLNNGQHIQLFSSIEHVMAYYRQNKRMGGEHVLQQYIDNPHLLRGHKYSIRVFLILTNYAGAFIYPYGYFNIAREAYCPDFQDKRPHLTNEHLYTDESNVIQIPSEKFDFFPHIFLEIQKMSSILVDALKSKYPNAFNCKNKHCVEIFGLDFIVDADKKVWFIEANQRPCFPIEDEHPLQSYLYDHFWQEFVASFVLPIAKRGALSLVEYRSFIKIG